MNQNRTWEEVEEEEEREENDSVELERLWETDIPAMTSGP